MRVAVVGGGPAGLYFSVLARKNWPDWTIDIFERNPKGSTFGFGVVFSDETLGIFKEYDAESYDSIRAAFAYWDDVDVVMNNEALRFRGNGFCGCSRYTLLDILSDRAVELGVNLQYEQEILPENDAVLNDYDLVLLSDGINSMFRTANAEHFGTRLDWRPNHFIWLGSTQALDSFKYFFRETEHGVVVAHAYQYQKDASTWVVEMEDSTWQGFGFTEMDEAETMEVLAQVFANELGEHTFIADRLFWRNFPIITNKTWVKGNRVMLGDAKASAHYSIGSGTKLAMEDAIALFDAIRENENLADALRQYDTVYRTRVEKIQNAANVSLQWFEHMNMHWQLPRQAFAMSCMTRSKQVTYDNIRLRDADVVPRYERWFASHLAEQGHDIPGTLPPLFQPLNLAGTTIPNRFSLVPISQYRAREGKVQDWHFSHYTQRALGGAGLIMTEMTGVDAEAAFTEHCPVMATRDQAESWRPIIDFLHRETDSVIGMQIGHAGRRGAVTADEACQLRPMTEGAWPLISASPLSWSPNHQRPREMDSGDMARVRQQFVNAARLADQVGFDLLELNMANGTLLASFLSPLTNHRRDQHGGPIENRARFPLEVLAAVRDAWPRHKPLSVCLTASDRVEGGITMEDVLAVSAMLKVAGVDLISVAMGGTVAGEEPALGRMYQAATADRIRNTTGVSVLTTGNITTPDQGNTLVASMRTDLVGFGRPLLVNPFLPIQAASTYGVGAVRWPTPYARARPQAEFGYRRQWDEVLDMRVRLKPKSHALGA